MAKCIFVSNKTKDITKDGVTYTIRRLTGGEKLDIQDEIIQYQFTQEDIKKAKDNPERIQKVLARSGTAKLLKIKKALVKWDLIDVDGKPALITLTNIRRLPDTHLDFLEEEIDKMDEEVDEKN